LGRYGATLARIFLAVVLDNQGFLLAELSILIIEKIIRSQALEATKFFGLFHEISPPP
jgi:hypothetical protein